MCNIIYEVIYEKVTELTFELVSVNGKPGCCSRPWKKRSSEQCNCIQMFLFCWHS